MNAPTEEGFYLARVTPDKQWAVGEYRDGRFDAIGCGTWPASLFTEWIRIPDPDCLKAMEELASTQPLGEVNMGDADDGTPAMICVYCGRGAWGEAHAPTCPWQRAQPKTKE